MKRRRAGFLFFALLATVPLVLYLAKLQWEWLDTYEVYGELRQGRTLAVSSLALKSAFDHELMTIASCFRSLGGDLEQLSAEVGQGWVAWRQASRWPNLLQEIYLLQRSGAEGDGGEVVLRRWHQLEERWIEATWDPRLEALRRPMSAGKESSSRGSGHSLSPAWRPPPQQAPARRITALHLVSSLPAVMEPVSLAPGEQAPGQQAPVERAWLALVLDPQVLWNELFSDLSAMVFSPPNFEQVEIAVLESSSEKVVFSSSPIQSRDDFGRVDTALGLVDAGTDGSELPLYAWRPPPGQEAMPNWSRPPNAEDHAWFRDLWAHSYYSGYWQLYVRREGESYADRAQEANWRNQAASFVALGLICLALIMIAALARSAQQLARRQSSFLAGISHELRTPLAVLRGAGENLADAVVAEPAKIREYGQVIQDETQRLGEMVENTLHLARRGATAADPELHLLDAGRLVAECVERMSRLFTKAAAEVKLEVAEEDLEVKGSRRTLQSAVYNLLSNALKYGATGAPIRVQVRRGGAGQQEEVQITVEDRGAGIDGMEQRRLFEPFFRGQRAREQQIEGSGLGLALVRDVVRAHRGRVSLDSEPGKGSRFTIHLPAARP